MIADLGLDTLTLLRPAWLLALPLIALLLWRRAPAEDLHSPWAAVVDAHLQAAMLRPQHLARPPRAALGTSLVMAVLALAGPARLHTADIALRSSAARVIVVDLSPGAGDIIDSVRTKLLDLLQHMPPGQTALVVYAEEPYLVAPPTTDAHTLHLLVPEFAPELMPLAGNRPERALRMAQDILARSGARMTDLLWISAAQPTAPDTAPALAALAEHGVRISRLQPEPAPDTPPSAPAIRATGGLDLPLVSTDDDVSQLIALWERLPAPVASAANTVAPGPAPRDFGPWLLLAVLPLAAIALRPAFFAAALLVIALPGTLTPMDARATEQPDPADPRWQAVAHYRAGRYAEAAAALEGLSDADSLYNRGTALARLNALPDAFAALTDALALRPDDPDIRHNHELVRTLLNPPPSSPPPPQATSAPPQAGAPNTADAEARRLAEQWQRRVPDAPAKLLRQKLLLEHERRQRGEVPRTWQ